MTPRLSRWTRFKGGAEAFAVRPVFAVIVTLAVALTGALASIYSREIRDTLLSFWWEGQFSLAVTFFWALFMATGLLFGVQRWAELRRRQRDQGRLEESAQTLLEAVRTLPPRRFLHEHDIIYEQCEQAAAPILLENDDSPPIDDIVRAARNVLLGLAKLADAFEDEPGSAVYNANIMLFLPASDLSEAQQATVRERLAFCEREVAVHQLRGVLDLRRDLSATTAAVNPDEIADESLAPLALAIPTEENETILYDGEKRLRILPGAPRAWVERRLQGFTDASALLDWCRREGAFSATIIQELKHYFTGDSAPKIGSFISSHLSIGSEDPVGVVNIHRTSPGILKNQAASAALFFHVSRPLLLLLTRLIEELRRQEYAQYGVWRHLARDDASDTIAT